MKINLAYRNAIWMMLEKIISIFGLFFVTSYVAKYIGPELFGVLSLAMAIFQIVQVIAQMGGDNIIFKRISNNRYSGIMLMVSSTIMRTLFYFLLALPVVLYFYFYVGGYAFYFSIAVAVSCLFLSLDVISIYNNAVLQSKLNTIANAIGLTISLLVRYLIAFFKFDPVYLCFPIVLAPAIPFFIKLYIFNKNNPYIISQSFKWGRTSFKYSKYMLFSGFSVVLASISIAIYTRVNQFFISEFLGNKELGLYAVAITLATSWGFVLSSVITSFYPSIYAEDNEKLAMRKTANLNRVVFGVGLIFCLMVILCGKFILAVLYGDEYSGAYHPMIILCFSTIFSSLGIVSYRFIIKYSGFSFISKKMFFVLVISIPISASLIMWLGLAGAAISVVVIEILSLTVMNYFFKNGIILKMHAMSFFQRRG